MSCRKTFKECKFSLIARFLAQNSLLLPLINHLICKIYNNILFITVLVVLSSTKILVIDGYDHGSVNTVYKGTLHLKP